MVLKIEPDVGARLRILREQRGLSLRELAERCDLSFNAIGRIERGDSSPTVSTLHQLANALEVSIGALFENGHEGAVVFIPRDRRLRSEANGISMESLGSGLRDQKLEPFLATVVPGAGSSPITHNGEEFVHCLAGIIRYQVNDETYSLEAGDSLLFEASQAHCFTNPGDTAALLLLVFQAGDGVLLAGQHHLLA
jgi:transcriptional regulator with XRE-family HTH domain